MDLTNFIMKGISKVLLAVTLLFNAGCETPNPLPPVEPGGGIVDMDERPVNSTDSLEPGNQITITFSGLSTVPVPYACRIREDGTISPPYLKNPVVAAGKRLVNLRANLKRLTSPIFTRQSM